MSARTTTSSKAVMDGSGGGKAFLRSSVARRGAKSPCVARPVPVTIAYLWAAGHGDGKSAIAVITQLRRHGRHRTGMSTPSVFPPLPVRKWGEERPRPVDNRSAPNGRTGCPDCNGLPGMVPGAPGDKRLRWYLEREPKALGAALHIVLRVIERHLQQTSAGAAPGRALWGGALCPPPQSGTEPLRPF